MKKFVTVFALTIFVFQSTFASEDSEIVKNAGEIFVRTYVESKAKQYADQFIYEQIIKEAGENAAETATEETAKESLAQNTVSTAFAVYNIVNSVKAYDEADSESQRYYASAQAAAAVISMIAPPVGMIASLVVVGQQLYGAAIAANYSMTIAKIQSETMAIYLQASDIQLKIINQELNYVKQIYSEFLTIPAIFDRITKMQEEKCTNIQMNSLEELDFCIGLVRIKRNMAEVRLDLVTKMMNLSGQYINFETLLKMLKVDRNVFENLHKQSEEQLTVLNNAVADIEKAYLQAMSDFMKYKNQNDPEYKKQVLIIDCNNQQFANVEQLLFIKKELTQKQDVISRLHIKARLTRTILDQKSRFELMCPADQYQNSAAGNILVQITNQLKVQNEKTN